MDKIIAQKKLEVEIQKRNLPLDDVKRSINTAKVAVATRGFKDAILKPGKVSLIAEIKKASPSRGVIRSDFVPEAIARIYEENGAAAISVLTDREFFQGDLSFLAKVRSATSHTPILRKDFIIDEYQIYQSRLAGADAILLIAAILDVPVLSKFLSTACSIGLECLVEVHTEDELSMVLKTEELWKSSIKFAQAYPKLEAFPKLDAPVIGINNRDLNTFQTDIHTTARLMRLLPADRVVVSESGISSKEDVEFLRKHGVNAMLVGESLMKSDDIGLKMRQLMSM